MGQYHRHRVKEGEQRRAGEGGQGHSPALPGLQA